MADKDLEKRVKSLEKKVDGIIKILANTTSINEMQTEAIRKLAGIKDKP